MERGRDGERGGGGERKAKRERAYPKTEKTKKPSDILLKSLAMSAHATSTEPEEKKMAGGTSDSQTVAHER